MYLYFLYFCDDNKNVFSFLTQMGVQQFRKISVFQLRENFDKSTTNNGGRGIQISYFQFFLCAKISKNNEHSLYKIKLHTIIYKKCYI